MWKRFAAIEILLSAVIVISWSRVCLANGFDTILDEVIRGVPCAAAIFASSDSQPKYALVPIARSSGELYHPGVEYAVDVLAGLPPEARDWEKGALIREPGFPFLLKFDVHGAPPDAGHLNQIGKRFNEIRTFFLRHIANPNLRDGVVLQVTGRDEVGQVLTRLHQITTNYNAQVMNGKFSNSVKSGVVSGVVTATVSAVAYGLTKQPLLSTIPFLVGGSVFAHGNRSDKDKAFPNFLRVCDGILGRGADQNWAYYATQENLVTGPTVSADGRYDLSLIEGQWLGVEPGGKLFSIEYPHMSVFDVDMFFKRHGNTPMLTIYIREKIEKQKKLPRP